MEIDDESMKTMATKTYNDNLTEFDWEGESDDEMEELSAMKN
jgi:hypothetical protein